MAESAVSSACMVQRFRLWLGTLLGGFGEIHQGLARELGHTGVGVAEELEQHPEPAKFGGIDSNEGDWFGHERSPLDYSSPGKAAS